MCMITQTILIPIQCLPIHCYLNNILPNIYASALPIVQIRQNILNIFTLLLCYMYVTCLHKICLSLINNIKYNY